MQKLGCWKLFCMAGTDIVSTYSPGHPVNTHWKELTTCIAAGEVCLGWRRASRQPCMQSKVVGNVSALWVSPHSLALRTTLPSLAWKEECLGLTSGHLYEKSCTVTTLSFAQFLLLLIVTALSVNPESYLYCWAIYHCIFPEWCSVAHVYGLKSGCDSPLEKVSSFFKCCHQQSIVFKQQSWGTLSDSAF